MKKISILLLIFILTCTVCFVSCSDNISGNENITIDEDRIIPVVPGVINVAAIKGPTGMGLAKFMEDETTTLDTDPFLYEFSLETAADAITPKLITGEIDIATVPANLAAVLYNKTQGGIVAIDINTLGVLYIVENGTSVNNVSDLRGKTIYASGKGNTPEYALNYMLENSGLVPGADVFIEFKTEHSECLAAILKEENAVAMLPQPFVTTAQMQNENIRIALDINKVWEESTGKIHVTGVTVARKALVTENPMAVTSFMAGHKESAEFINTDENAANVIERQGIFNAAVAKNAIPYCNITYIDGEEMKSVLSEYLNILASQNIQAVGGAVPGDDFYFINENVIAE